MHLDPVYFKEIFRFLWFFMIMFFSLEVGGHLRLGTSSIFVFTLGIRYLRQASTLTFAKRTVITWAMAKNWLGPQSSGGTIAVHFTNVTTLQAGAKVLEKC